MSLRPRPHKIALYWAAVFCLYASPAFAHRLDRSFLEMHPSGSDILVSVDLDPHDTPLLADIDINRDGSVSDAEVMAQHDILARWVFGRIIARVSGDDCQWDGRYRDRFLTDVAMWHADATWHCSGAASNATLIVGYLDQLPPTHQVFARIVKGDAGTQPTMVQRVLHRGDDVLQPPKPWHEARRFVWLGIAHILDGLDHLAFILALILVATSIGQAAIALTAFTVAHSLTLALAGLHIVTLPSRAVEVAIAASIVFVAIENVVGRLGRYRVLLAFIFGLVHGLGFASLLEEAQYTPQQLVVGLFAFNIGIEIGQLTIVALILPPLLALKAARFKWWHIVSVSLVPAVLWLGGAPFNAQIVAALMAACAFVAALVRSRRWVVPGLTAVLVVSGTAWAVSRL